MRKKDKEITDASAINAIIKKATVCRLGLVNGDRPYIVPLCFGYHENTLYFHGALKGLKIDLIKSNSNVCFELDIASEPISAVEACKWEMKYQSVIGFGKAALVKDPAEKATALAIIMAQYSDRQFQFPDNKVEATGVIKVDIESMTGKQSGYEGYG